MEAREYPLISIVIPCHNRAPYIADAIESVLSQNYPNTDLIVIDDNSTDGSWEIIERYKDKLGHYENLNINATSAQEQLEYGFRKARGEVMGHITDKGLMLPGSLHTIGRIFAEYSDVEWITAITTVVNEHGEIISLAPIRKDLHEHLIHVPWNMQAESTFWRRELWNRAGATWDNGLGWAADYGLWCHFFAVGAKLWHVNTILGAYRKTPSASGVKNPKQYYDSAAKYRAWLRTHVPKQELVYASLYSVLRYLKPLLRNIPDSVYQHIPVLNHFSHASIGYKDMHSLKRWKRNPFRTIYPW
jgi:glycosyltransferase involved in cell wall biosynthesis